MTDRRYEALPTRLDPDAVGRDFDHLWSEYEHAVAEIERLRAALHEIADCDCHAADTARAALLAEDGK